MPTRQNRMKWFLVMLFLAGLAFPVSGQEEKVKGAQKEGSLLVYGSTTITEMEPLLKRFKAKYPFLDVKFLRGGSERLLQRIQIETRSGSSFADAIILRQGLLLQLKDQGMLSRYESPEAKWIQEMHKDRDGYWSGIYSHLQWVGYNTALVPAADVPKKREDLLDPKWKGKIGLDPAADYEWFIGELHIMGEEKGMKYMRELAKQNIQFRRGHTLLAQLLAAGEFPLILTLRANKTFESIKKGAPIGWVVFEPLLPLPAQALGIAKNAPHPNAARLFVDYMLSREAQEQLSAMEERPSTRVDVELFPEVRHIKFGKIDWPLYLRRYNKYVQMFNEVFGLR